MRKGYDRLRRVSPVPARLSEGRFTPPQATADARPRPRERVLMPLSGPLVLPGDFGRQCLEAALLKTAGCLRRVPSVRVRPSSACYH
jgi:hypothetical protein